MKPRLTLIRTTLITFITVHAAHHFIFAQTGGGYDLTWNTFDGGGQMFSAAGGYSLGGTIGQHDAGPATGPLTGGTYSLVGGFWPASVCLCASDLNFDRKRDGLDVDGFIDCYLAAGHNCGCADMNRDGLLNATDLSQFVSGLLAVGTCP